MKENYFEAIEDISYRFDNKILPSQIFKWLKNFEEDDWGKALTVLNKTEYFSTINIIREFDSFLQQVIIDYELNTKQKVLKNILSFLGLGRTRLFTSVKTDQQIILHPVGEFLKSGTSMFYLLKQTTAFKKYSEYIRVVDNYQELERRLSQDSLLVLVDDIAGSGGTVIKYYNEKLRQIIAKPKFKNVKIVSLNIVYLEVAEKKLMEYNIRIYGNGRNAVFSQVGSIFGYRPKMIEIREFCYKYGKGLYTTKNPEDGKITDHPLGHDNSQALVIFEHSTPNNTLPIFWSSRKKWHPLFPRFGHDKIELAYNLKFDTYKWISQLEAVGFKSLFKDDNKYQKINLQLLMVLRLKKMGKQDKAICQYLSINILDLNKIITDGTIRGIFHDNGLISEYGNDIYYQIKKKEQFLKSERIEFYLSETFTENIYYLPTMFRGMT